MRSANTKNSIREYLKTNPIIFLQHAPCQARKNKQVHKLKIPLHKVRKMNFPHLLKLLIKDNKSLRFLFVLVQVDGGQGFLLCFLEV